MKLNLGRTVRNELCYDVNQILNTVRDLRDNVINGNLSDAERLEALNLYQSAIQVDLEVLLERIDPATYGS